MSLLIKLPTEISVSILDDWLGGSLCAISALDIAFCPVLTTNTTTTTTSQPSPRSATNAAASNTAVAEATAATSAEVSLRAQQTQEYLHILSKCPFRSHRLQTSSFFSADLQLMENYFHWLQQRQIHMPTLHMAIPHMPYIMSMFLGKDLFKLLQNVEKLFFYDDSSLWGAVLALNKDIPTSNNQPALHNHHPHSAMQMLYDVFAKMPSFQDEKKVLAERKDVLKQAVRSSLFIFAAYLPHHLYDIDMRLSENMALDDIFTILLHANGQQGRALTKLSLTFCEELTDSQFINTMQLLSSNDNEADRGMGLQQLELKCITQLTKEALDAIGRFHPHLQELALTYCSSITALDIVEDFLARDCKSIIALDLTGKTDLTPNHLQTLLQHCPQLQRLVLNDCPQIKFPCLAQVLQHSASLQYYATNDFEYTCQKVLVKGFEDVAVVGKAEKKKAVYRVERSLKVKGFTKKTYELVNILDQAYPRNSNAPHVFYTHFNDEEEELLKWAEVEKNSMALHHLDLSECYKFDNTGFEALLRTTFYTKSLLTISLNPAQKCDVNLLLQFLRNCECLEDISFVRTSFINEKVLQELLDTLRREQTCSSTLKVLQLLACPGIDEALAGKNLLEGI